MSDNSEKTVFDASPYLKLFIDKDGRWFQNGAEITHPEVYRQFNGMLERDCIGGYRVRMGPEICAVEVEDAPFVVQRVWEDELGAVQMELNDGSHEAFDPKVFWIGDDNVPYSYVKQENFHARFSRPAYYQIARYIVQGGETEFFFMIRGTRTPILKKPALCNSAS
jgi:hypothetical protein